MADADTAASCHQDTSASCQQINDSKQAVASQQEEVTASQEEATTLPNSEKQGNIEGEQVNEDWQTQFFITTNKTQTHFAKNRSTEFEIFLTHFKINQIQSISWWQFWEK